VSPVSSVSWVSPVPAVSTGSLSVVGPPVSIGSVSGDAVTGAPDSQSLQSLQPASASYHHSAIRSPLAHRASPASSRSPVCRSGRPITPRRADHRDAHADRPAGGGEEHAQPPKPARCQLPQSPVSTPSGSGAGAPS
jgi:hypothetical protein